MDALLLKDNFMHSPIKMIRGGGNFYYSKKYNLEQFNNKKNEIYNLIKFKNIIYDKYKEYSKCIPETYIGVHIRSKDSNFFKMSDKFNLNLFEKNILECVNNNNINNILLIGDRIDLINKFKNQLIMI